MGEVSGRWFNDQEKPETYRRPREQRNGGGASGPDRCSMGAVGTVAAPEQEGGPPAAVDETADHRRIRWRTRVGCPWHDIPPQYGSWSAVNGLFRRWQRGGVWLVIVKLLQVFAEAGGRIRWQVSVDSTNRNRSDRRVRTPVGTT
ncbi:transposase [Nocardia sp. NPDC049707]|uniref:transposase n=1 Tax=Nocardia sp. NPDC049707 TaxID=3154735 RepID=UPI00341AE9D5